MPQAASPVRKLVAVPAPGVRHYIVKFCRFAPLRGGADQFRGAESVSAFHEVQNVSFFSAEERYPKF
jgi:hypothetical protein